MIVLFYTVVVGKGTNWAAISEELGRYRHSVRDKWKQMLQTGHKPNKWNEEETRKLQTCVEPSIAILACGGFQPLVPV